MKPIYQENQSRGLADHGWLKSRHTFSFADYYNPERMNFGLLRVLNDDIVTPSMGFGTHPHENMEIISIPLSGSLRHQDSMGNKHIISTGEVQIMSAGSGITHSEYNNSDLEEVNFLQIWTYPKEKNIEPRYGQQLFDKNERHNRFQTLVSPEKDSSAIWINQDAWFSQVDLDSGAVIDYNKQRSENGLYVFVISGAIIIAGHDLKQRDGLGLAVEDKIQVKALSQAEVLCMEIPL